MRSAYVAFGVGLALLLCSVAHAQVGAPQINPGTIQNDFDRQRERFEHQEQTPKQQGPGVVGPEREKNPALQPGGPKFLLRRVRLDSSKFLTAEELKTITEKYVGKQVDIATLQQLVADINALYSQKGIVTGIATLPEQDSSGGVIHIKLTEGRLQNTSVEGNKQTAVNYILQRVQEPSGEVLDVPKLNRDVMWFNRTNDVQIKALLQPGTSFGLTDLQFAVTDPPINTLQLFADNQGVQTTGQNELGVFYKLHGLLGIDDRLTFYGVKSDGNINGNVAYNVPINPWGGRLGGSYTDGDIKIIQGPFQSLNITGKSNQSAANFSQPLWVSENWLFLVNAAQTWGNTVSDFSSVDVTDDRYTKSTGGIALTSSGKDYSVTISPSFNAIDWHDKILGGERIFDTFSGSATVYAKLPDKFSLSFLSSWQYTTVHLLPGDQLFSIGGPTTVRGYPTNSVAGDSGYYFNVELHYNWSDLIKGLDTFVFCDSGAVYSTFPRESDLTSSGAGVSWTPFAALTFEASYGAPWRIVVPNQPHYEAYGRVIFRPLLLLPQPS